MSRAKNLAGLIGCFLVTFAAAAVGSLASIRASEFYQELSRPSWAPSARVFGPVWSTLFCLMAVACWLVWRTDHPRRRAALTTYAVQLVLNALWSWLFFVWHEGRWALIEVIILWFFILLTIILFWQVRRWAALFLAPYLLWVAFAAWLTFAVWRLNPQLLS